MTPHAVPWRYAQGFKVIHAKLPSVMHTRIAYLDILALYNPRIWLCLHQPHDVSVKLLPLHIIFENGAGEGHLSTMLI
jgi:hypothetical protein